MLWYENLGDYKQRLPPIIPTPTCGGIFRISCPNHQLHTSSLSTIKQGTRVSKRGGLHMKIFGLSPTGFGFFVDSSFRVCGSRVQGLAVFGLRMFRPHGFKGCIFGVEGSGVQGFVSGFGSGFLSV